ncbi:hypothetical protein Hanom_Chr06g00563421 [Helianthus anomalus]
MDDEVPPPKPKVTIYDFGSDSDDEIDEKEWAAYQRSLLQKEVTKKEVELGDSIGLMFGAEEENEEVAIKSSREDEFLELELDGLPVY